MISSTQSSVIKLAILGVILSLHLSSVQIAAIFDPNRIRVVDWIDNPVAIKNHATTTTSTAILLRGNVPLNSHGVYDPYMLRRHIENGILRLNAPKNINANNIVDEEVSMISKSAAKSTSSARKIDKLIIVSLLSSKQSDEKKILEAQYGFHNEFKMQQLHKQQTQLTTTTSKTLVQSQYEFIHKPIAGSWLLLPILTKIPIINDIAWTYMRPDDGAWNIAEDIRSMLLSATTTAMPTTTSDTTISPAGSTTVSYDTAPSSTGITVVYIHCMRGIDRTGLVAGTYLARYGNDDNTTGNNDEAAMRMRNKLQTSKIQELNYNVGKREINWLARTSLQWVFWRRERQRDTISRNP